MADLLDELGQSQPISEELMDAALELDKAYIPTRYPNAHPSGSPRRRYTCTEAERMVTHAEGLVLSRWAEPVACTELSRSEALSKESSGSVRVFYPPFSREQLLVLLRRRIKGLQGVLPVKRVVLFGSYAKGKHTVASDIDLLVVYGGEPRDDAYALVKRILNIRRLEPHVYTEGEYAQVKATLERMLKDSIPLDTSLSF